MNYINYRIKVYKRGLFRDQLVHKTDLLSFKELYPKQIELFNTFDKKKHRLRIVDWTGRVCKELTKKIN